jgi:SulP family sulfate permease
VPASHAVTVLDVYGSLFYAGSRTLQARLPDPSGSEQAVVVIRLRGRTSFGATFYSVVASYADLLEQRGGRLYLSGLDPQVAARLAAHAQTPPTGAAHLYPATDVLGESTLQAVDDASTWLVHGAGRG